MRRLDTGHPVMVTPLAILRSVVIGTADYESG